MKFGEDLYLFRCGIGPRDDPRDTNMFCADGYYEVPAGFKLAAKKELAATAARTEFSAAEVEVFAV